MKAEKLKDPLSTLRHLAAENGFQLLSTVWKNRASTYQFRHNTRNTIHEWGQGIF